MDIRRTGEVSLNWKKWARRSHRWLSIVFTVAVIINGVMVAKGKYNNRMGLVAVALIALLLITGLYLFALPYVTKRRGVVDSADRENASR